MEELKVELRQIVSSIGKLSNDFDAGADLYRDLGLGSFIAVDLLVALEERYGVAIPDTQYMQATSLERLTDMMQGLLEKA